MTMATEMPKELCRFTRVYDRVRYESAPRRDRSTEQPDVYVLIGAPGVGKTRWVWANEPDLYPKDNSKWWDGYCGQEAVLWDDFRGNYDYDEFLRVLDRYPLQVQVKGGYAHMNAKRIYITSNVHWKKWFKQHVYDGDQDRWLPIERRLTAVWELPADEALMRAHLTHWVFEEQTHSQTTLKRPRQASPPVICLSDEEAPPDQTGDQAHPQDQELCPGGVWQVPPPDAVYGD